MKRAERETLTEEGFVLKFRERELEEITLKVPKDVVRSLEKVAAKRAMSTHALLKLYIGHQLRQDLARMFSENVLEKTEEVLNKHLDSQKQVSEILREIKTDLAA